MNFDNIGMGVLKENFNVFHDGFMPRISPNKSKPQETGEPLPAEKKGGPGGSLKNRKMTPAEKKTGKAANIISQTRDKSIRRLSSAEIKVWNQSVGQAKSVKIKLSRLYPFLKSSRKDSREEVFADESIVKIYPFSILDTISIGNRRKIAIYGFDGKHAVIQQIGELGNAEGAATAMLIYDSLGNIPILAELLNFPEEKESEAHIMSMIRKAGLKPISGRCLNDLDRLKEAIEKRGAAILISLGSKDHLGGNGHVFVVDEISKTTVTLRDPYHAWRVTVKRKAVEELYPCSFIQVAVA